MEKVESSSWLEHETVNPIIAFLFHLTEEEEKIQSKSNNWATPSSARDRVWVSDSRCLAIVCLGDPKSDYTMIFRLSYFNAQHIFSVPCKFCFVLQSRSAARICSLRWLSCTSSTASNHSRLFLFTQTAESIEIEASTLECVRINCSYESTDFTSQSVEDKLGQKSWGRAAPIRARTCIEEFFCRKISAFPKTLSRLFSFLIPWLRVPDYLTASRG